MKSYALLALGMVSLLVLSGCASVKIGNRQKMAAQRLPRPANILVHDFVATAADVPADEGLTGAGSEGPAPQTAEEIELGRELGADIGKHLVAGIRALGMPAEHASAASAPRINDLVVRGYLLSMEEGSAAKRVAIGFRSGNTEMKTLVEVFQMTPSGLRKLGSGELDARGNRTPGTAVGLASFLATRNPAGLIISGGMKLYGEGSGKNKIEGRAEQTAKEISGELKKKFQEQGWI